MPRNEPDLVVYDSLEGLIVPVGEKVEKVVVP
jgi:hypothetical protein